MLKEITLYRLIINKEYTLLRLSSETTSRIRIVDLYNNSVKILLLSNDSELPSQFIISMGNPYFVIVDLHIIVTPTDFKHLKIRKSMKDE